MRAHQLARPCRRRCRSPGPPPWCPPAACPISLQRLQRHHHAAAPGGLGTPARPAQRHRLAGHHRRDRVARVHGVGVHDPRHHLLVGVHVRRRHVALRSDEVDDLRRVAPGQLFQFRVGQDVRVADHAAFAAAEGNVDHRAFPGHPRGQRAHFVQRHIGSEADAALGRPARDRVLHTVAGEDLDPSIVQLHRDVNRDFSWRKCRAPCAFRRPASAGRRLIKARGGGEPWILFVL